MWFRLTPFWSSLLEHEEGLVEALSQVGVEYLLDALYGRGCAETVQNQVTNMENEEVDLLTKIIVKMLAKAKGKDLDHQANVVTPPGNNNAKAEERERERVLVT